MNTIRIPKVRVRKKKPAPPPPTGPMPTRADLLAALAEMPDEAFGWFLLRIPDQVWPDGLGGFQDASRTSIEKVREIARRIVDEGGRW
jgi:hypothetical protein